jgi:uncharacterized membrane protein YbhN (UPF0104 family)
MSCLPLTDAAPRPRPASVAIDRIGRALPRGWSDLGVQLALFALLQLAYELSRVFTTGDRAIAIGHARDIVSAERSLGMFHELDVQHFAASAPGFVQGVANWTYFNCQFTISFAFVLWVYLRRNESFPVVRNVLFTANALGLVGYMLYPAAPPRMLPDLGFVDTLNQTAVNHNSGVIASLSNPYAAMPSLHTAYALIVGASAVWLVRRPALRAPWALYPALVVFSIVATANHFFLDAIAGAGVAVAAALLVAAVARLGARRTLLPLAAAGAAAMALPRAAHQAGDVVDALTGVALGAIALALVANLVSVWLKAAVWRQAVAAVPGAPPVTTRMLLPSVFIGFLLNTVLIARLGEVARVLVLRRRMRADGADVGAAAIAGTLVAEQIALGLALVVIGGALAVTVVDVPGWAVAALAALAALALGAVLAGAIARRARVAPPARLARMAAHVQELGGGLHILHRPRALAAAVALGAASWAAQIAGIYWTLEAFGLPSSLVASSAVFLVSTLIGLFPIMPGNVGVFQIAVAGALAAFGVGAASGAAFAIGLQATELALGAGIGAIYLAVEGLSIADLRRGAVTAADAPDPLPGRAGGRLAPRTWPAAPAAPARASSTWPRPVAAGDRCRPRRAPRRVAGMPARRPSARRPMRRRCPT